ncbi:MAG: diaminopimelate epimerase, partial [Actinomycetota bacterium]|nr:diaminopimelate epimerase [Actinomycetota bacterium]
MRFTKAHGSGNDFVVLPDWEDRLELTSPLVRALCDRHHGLGGDGVLRVLRGRDGFDVFMDYRNADGSLAALCGNGLRVVAQHVIDHGLVRPPDGRLRIGTRAGTKEVTVRRADDGRVAEVTAELGAPSLDPRDVPFDTDGSEAVALPLTVGTDRVRLTAVRLGNPHAVVVVEQVDRAPVRSLGPAVERHPRFPERTNVQVARENAPGDVTARVWERGVGETASS